ncbi:hypothetical protein LN615_20370, partial [Proteus terrae]|uniref:hypothetical protein n=1 Tax=Proteus terrae TaxID=1574161 RepID=UPI00207C9BE9
MNDKQKKKKLLTFISPVLSLVISFYLSISTFGYDNIIWLATSSAIFFISIIVLVSSLEIWSRIQRVDDISNVILSLNESPND